MGLFSSLFGGGKKADDVNDPQVQALRQFFKEKLPANYVNSPKYKVSIAKSGQGYAARITLDMLSDGSDYAGFGKEDFDNLSELESDYVFDMLAGPPAAVLVTFDMDFGKQKIAVEKGQPAVK